MARVLKCVEVELVVEVEMIAYREAAPTRNVSMTTL